jgi:hypothetical protein
MAAFSCPAVKAYVDFANSVGQYVSHLRLYKAVDFHYEP